MGRRDAVNMWDDQGIAASGRREKITPRQPGDTSPAKHPHSPEVEDEPKRQPDRDRKADEARQRGEAEPKSTARR